MSGDWDSSLAMQVSAGALLKAVNEDRRNIYRRVTWENV